MKNSLFLHPPLCICSCVVSVFVSNPRIRFLTWITGRYSYQLKRSGCFCLPWPGWRASGCGPCGPSHPIPVWLWQLVKKKWKRKRGGGGWQWQLNACQLEWLGRWRHYLPLAARTLSMHLTSLLSCSKFTLGYWSSFWRSEAEVRRWRLGFFFAKHLFPK